MKENKTIIIIIIIIGLKPPGDLLVNQYFLLDGKI